MLEPRLPATMRSRSVGRDAERGQRRQRQALRPVLQHAHQMIAIFRRADAPCEPDSSRPTSAYFASAAIVRLALLHRRDVDPRRGRHQRAADHAVRNGKQRAERRGQPVHRAEPGLRQTDARQQRRIGHVRRAPRPPRAPPSYQASKPSRTARKPDSASASVNGLALRRDVGLPASCVSASMPLAAISAGGQPASRSGSTMAISATSASSRNDFLKPSGPCRDSTAFLVASEPVPAVVGTAMNGVAGPR